MGSKLEQVLLSRKDKPPRHLIGITDRSRDRAVKEKLPPPPDAPSLFKGTTIDELEKRLLARNK